MTFDNFRSVLEDGPSPIARPVYNWYDSEDGSIQVAASGPFQSTGNLFQHASTAKSNENVWRKAEAKVLEVIMGCLPTLESTSLPGFVLYLPDFDSRNVMVDEEDTVTGLVDWDLAHTMPRFMGYARYPGWITSDWDHVMYG